MKKVYLLGGILLFGAVAMAQQTTKSYNFNGAKLSKYNFVEHGGQHAEIAPSANQDRVLNILWTEDFSGSGTLVTNNGTWTTAGTSAAYWTIGTTAHPLSSFGWTHSMNARHLRWDSYNPNATETGGFATTAVSGSITSPTIDLSGQTNGAVLEFITESMYCCNYEEKPWNLYVSEDDGATWSPAIPMDFGVDRNVATEDVQDPMIYALDISPYIQNTPSTVKIRVDWTGTNADGNGQINTHYFWMLDNMTIYEAPLYEIQHQKLWLEDIAAWFEYGDISLNQAPTLTVQSLVKSLGTNNPSAFGLEVTVYNSGMTQIHQSTGGTLANPPMSIGDVDTLTYATTFDLATLAPGTYTVRAVTSYTETDELESNDTLWRTFEITDNVFSHMNYDAPTTQYYPGGTANESYQIGASFLLYQDAELHGAEFYVGPGTGSNPTTDDAVIEFYLYEWDGAAYSYAVGWDPMQFTISAAMQGQMNTFNFHLNEGGSAYTPYSMTAGTEYVLVMAVLAGDVVWYGANTIDEDASGRLLAEDGNWYLSDGEPMIGLNFDVSLGMEEVENTNFAVGQNVPNPFNGTSVITYTLKETSNVNITFTDVTGKVVKTIAPGTQEAGSYTITVDAADMAEGVYFYTFTIGDNKVTKQMVVSKK